MPSKFCCASTLVARWMTTFGFARNYFPRLAASSSILSTFYFHNFVYESMWKDNRRRHAERIPTLDITHKYGSDYKLIFVGDATMSPYEIVYAGGSVEHWNEEPGAVWIKRLLNTYSKAIWLNPEPQHRWDYTPSVKLTRDLME